jgi:hypothetical protein
MSVVEVLRSYDTEVRIWKYTWEYGGLSIEIPTRQWPKNFRAQRAERSYRDKSDDHLTSYCMKICLSVSMIKP